nr:MAG TPA: hypothetical protein [Caudoviricetes sp.]
MLPRKKRAGELVHLFFYTGCVQCIALIFYAEKISKKSKIVVDLVPKRDYIIYNKRETEGHTSTQERGTQ